MDKDTIKRLHLLEEKYNTLKAHISKFHTEHNARYNYKIKAQWVDGSIIHLYDQFFDPDFMKNYLQNANLRLKEIEQEILDL